MTTYYHKASIVGLINLFETFKTDSRICVSTENSSRLFWRDIVLVMETKDENILCSENNDIDARIGTEYDETRISFSSKAAFLKAVKYVIIDGKIVNSIRKENIDLTGTIEGDLPFKFFNGNHEAANKAACKCFFATTLKNKVLNLTQAKKINKDWTRKYLNI